MERISWDDYFMVQALWARIRSQDESTKCGCILIDKNNKLIGQGYNGHPRKVNFDKMPKERPAKYGPIIHSENNAILNCAGNLEEATAYITGPPCTHCWAQLIQVGIKKVVYGPIVTSSKGLYADTKLDSFPQVVNDMLENQNIKVIKWQPNNINLILLELMNLINLIKENY